MRFVGRTGLILVFGLVLAAFCAGTAAFAYARVTNKKPLTKKEVSVTQSLVKSVQQALIDAGYKTTVCGAFGPKTRLALKKYQKRNGLRVTGHIDRATRRKMGIN